MSSELDPAAAGQPESEVVEEISLAAEPETQAPDPGFDLSLAQGNFEFAKTRYIRTLTRDSIARMVASTAAQRNKLSEEIRDLTAVTRDRHEKAVERARAYASILPHRVGKTWIQAPTALEKVGQFHGSDRLYHMARKAAHDYTEARDVLVKRKDELANMERILRNALEDNEAIIMTEIESGRGLQNARKRDPLLDMAYKKMRALEGKSLETPESGLGDF